LPGNEFRAICVQVHARMKLLCLIIGFITVSFTHLFAQTNDVPQLVSAQKIWHGDTHNAFTDLIRFQSKWFCTFRESLAHVGGNGKIRVLTSADGDHWESAALVTEEGIDLRDPKFSITPDNRLMLALGGAVYEGKKLKERQSRVAFSKDGRNWTAPKPILEMGDWLWRVTWHKGVAYGISYKTVTATTNNSYTMNVKLVSSDNGVKFRLITKLDVPGNANEATVRFLENGDCMALVRRETADKEAWIGISSAPYKDWKWHPAGMRIGGPNFIVLNDGGMIASGRDYGTKPLDHHTFVGRMDSQSVRPELLLPSGGDCSYAGMVWHEGLLWMSYYSSHEGATDIYLAKVRIPNLKK
jgi:hypothetical protein